MNKHDKTLKRIHGLFAEKKMPTSLTKAEREVLQEDYYDWIDAQFGHLDEADQRKNETAIQTLSRFEKSMLAAIKKTKGWLSKQQLDRVGVWTNGTEVIVNGRGLLSDKTLLKEEHKTWKWEQEQKSKQDATLLLGELQAKIAEQNTRIKQLTAASKQIKKAAKKARKTKQTKSR